MCRRRRPAIAAVTRYGRLLVSLDPATTHRPPPWSSAGGRRWPRSRRWAAIRPGCWVSPGSVNGLFGGWRPTADGSAWRDAPERHRTAPGGDLGGAGRDAAPVAGQHEDAGTDDPPVPAGEVRPGRGGALLPDVARVVDRVVRDGRHPAALRAHRGPGR